MEYGIYAMCKVFWLEKMGNRDRLLLKNLPFHDVEEKQSGDTKTGSVHGAVAVQTGQPRQSPWQFHKFWQEGT